MQTEGERALRVADMLVTGHSALRDKYGRMSLALDLTILFSSAWVSALSFADAGITKLLTIGPLPAAQTIGIAGVLTFIVSLFQLRVDWKQKADRHGQAAAAYASAKLQLTQALSAVPPDSDDLKRALDFYAQIGRDHVPIPDGKFNRLKKKHLIKVRVSKELSAHPGANISLIRLKLWFVDSLGLFKGV